MNQPISSLAALTARLPENSRRLIAASLEQHRRNGRGFWPALVVDGELQVIRFDRDPATDRWTAETGTINVVPVNALSPADWPHVYFSA